MGTVVLLNPYVSGGVAPGLSEVLLNGMDLLGVSSGGDEAFRSWLAANYQAGEPWTVLAATQDSVELLVRVEQTGQRVAVWWGDGTTEQISPASIPSGDSRSSLSHDYDSGGKAIVVLGRVADLATNVSTGSGVAGRAELLPSTLQVLSLGTLSELDGSVLDLPASLRWLDLRGGGDITGSTGDLPRSLTYLRLTGASVIDGPALDLPPSLEVLYLTGSSPVTGLTGDLPRSLLELTLQEPTTISGPMSGLPESLTRLVLGGSNQVAGPASDLPRGLLHLSLSGEANLSGDVAGLPTGLEYLNAGGLSTIGGVAADLPAGLTELRMTGDNTLGGAVADLPRNLTVVILSGSSSVSGPASDLPSGLVNLRLSSSGASNLSGVVGDLPDGLTELVLSGSSHTIGGNVSGLPAGLEYLYLGGQNVVTGDIAGLPRTLVGQMLITGQNTVSGDLADLPTGVDSVSFGGQNTVSGDMADLPSGVSDFYMTGPSTAAITLTTPSVPSGLSSVYLRKMPNGAHIDNLLQAIWNNRDAPKPRSTRRIEVSGPDSGNPSNQALIDSLRAYRSPNNDPQYPTWEITTNGVMLPPSDAEYIGFTQSNMSLSNRTTHTWTHDYISTEQDGHLALIVFFLGNDGDEDMTAGTVDPKVTFIVDHDYVDAGLPWIGYHIPSQASIDSGSISFTFITPSAEVYQFVIVEVANVDVEDLVHQSKEARATGSTNQIGPETWTDVPDGAIILACTVPRGLTAGSTISLNPANGFTEVTSQPGPGPGGNPFFVAYREIETGGTISGPVFVHTATEGQASTSVVLNPGGESLPPAGGDPDVVTVFTDTEVSYIDSGTSIAKDVPSFELGDVLYAAVMHRSALTPPSGWTLVKSQAEGGGSAANQTLSIYTRVAEVGDSSFTWTQASANRMGVQYVVARSTTGAVNVETIVSSGSQGLTEAYEHPLPSVTTTVAGSRVLAFSACVFSTSSVKLYGEPTGWTRHGALNESNNRMAVASLAMPEPGTISGATMPHNAWDEHSGSEIVLVLAPDESGTPPPDDEVFHAIEAEAMVEGSDFAVIDIASGYGGKAVEALVNGDGSVVHSTSVDVSEEALCRLWVRMRAVDGNHDAFYAGIDANILRRFPSVYGQWTWILVDEVTLSEGTHTVSFGAGEAGAVVDVLVLADATLTTGQIDARLGGTPTDPDPEPNVGDLNLVGNPSFSSSNPTWYDGTPITGAALNYYEGLVWWADPSHWSQHADKGIDDYATSGDAYTLARNLRDRLQAIVFAFILTKDLRFVDALVTAMNLTKADLKVGYRGHDTSAVTWSASPYRCWVNIYDQPPVLKGTDLNRLNETSWHAFVAQYTAILKANKEFSSPANHDYQAEYDFWIDYFTNDFLPKWQGGGTSGWRDEYRGIRRDPNYDSRRRAAAGEWPPVIAGNDVHSNISSVTTAYFGAELVPSQATAAMAEVDWVLEQWHSEDTVLIGGTHRLWSQTAKSHGSGARYAMASSYPGYVMGDMVMMYLLQYKPELVNPTLLTQMARVINDWFLVSDVTSTSKSATATMGDIAGEVLRGDMLTVNPQSRRNNGAWVAKPYDILMPWGGSKLVTKNTVSQGYSWVGSVTQPREPFPFLTAFIDLAPKPT